MPLDPMPPFDPGVASGYSTNLTAGAAVAAPVQQAWVFAGWKKVKSAVPELEWQGSPIWKGDKPITSTTRQRTYLTVDQFMSRFDNAAREDFLKLRNMFVAAGIVSPGASAYTTRNAFEALLEGVSSPTQDGAKMSPMGYVKNLIRMNGVDPDKIGSGENYGIDPATQPFTGTKTRTDRSVAHLGEGEAWTALRGTLTQMLGRDPEDQEVREFAFKMNQLAAENPSISETIQRYKDGDLVSTRTESIDEGFNESDVAREAYEDAQSDPEYAEYQAGVTYFNSVMSALGAIGQT